jgi:putative membrane protein
MTVTVATNTLFNKIDMEKIDSISDLTDSMTELNDAMTELLDGSSSLYNGLCTLLDKSGELVDGINQLADGAAKLKDGAYSLDDGAKKLSDGAVALSKGLDTLSTNNDQLNGGAKKVFETLLSTARTQLTAAGISVPEMTVENYASVLNGVIDSLDNSKIYDRALEQVTKAVEEKRDYIKAQVTDAVQKEVEAGVKSAVMEQVKMQVTEAVKEKVSEQVTATVREKVEAQIILAATGMDKTGYDTAVSAGLVDAATANTINSPSAIKWKVKKSRV